MYWYIILDGNKLPTPYLHIWDAEEAADELRERLCAPIIDIVLE